MIQQHFVDSGLERSKQRSPCGWLFAVHFANVAFLVLAFGGSALFADGLIFQLPPDGTWVRFENRISGEVSISAASAPETELQQQKVDVLRTLKLSSVGKVNRHRQQCRWIELISESSGTGPVGRHVLKLLIPEDRLQRGQDPFAHSVRTFFNPKEADQALGPQDPSIAEGFNRIQYEIDRFRPVFPPPLEMAQSRHGETVRVGEVEWTDCEVVTGIHRYDGPLAADGRWVFESKVTLILHPNAPFGVVSMTVDTDSTEYSTAVTRVTSVSKILLAAIGTNATSALEVPASAESTRSTAPTDGANDRINEQPNSTVCETAVEQIAELQRIFRANDANALRAIAIWGPSKEEKQPFDQFVNQIQAGEYAHGRVTPIASALDGPVLRVAVKFSGHPSFKQEAVPLIFVRRDNRWYWLAMIGPPRSALMRVLSVEELASWQRLEDGSRGDAK